MLPPKKLPIILIVSIVIAVPALTMTDGFCVKCQAATAAAQRSVPNLFGCSYKFFTPQALSLASKTGMGKGAIN